MLVRCCFEESVICLLGGGLSGCLGVGPTFGSSLLEGD